MKSRLVFLVAVVAGGSSIAGCYQILGLGSFGNCKGGNIDITVDCNHGGAGPGGAGPGGAGRGGSGAGAGGGTGGNPASSSSSATGGGGSGPTCTLIGGGMSSTVISATQVPNANWHSFLMVSGGNTNAPTYFAAADRASSTLYVSSVNDLSQPETPVTYPAQGGGDIDIYQGALVGSNLVITIRDTNQIGDVTIPLSGGHVQQNGITFTPKAIQPAACSGGGHPSSLSVDVDGSVAVACGDGMNPQTTTLYLDGQALGSSTGDDSPVNVVFNHKFQNGKRLLLTFGQQGGYFRLGTDAASLMTPTHVKLSAQSGMSIELLTPTTPQAYGQNDFVFLGAEVPIDFSSYTLYSGRVAATTSALSAQPPTGSVKDFSAGSLDAVLIGTHADSDGHTIAMAGPTPAQTSVLLDFFDNDGKPFVTNFPVLTNSPSAIQGAGVAHTGFGGSLIVGWADGTSVQAVGVLCTQ